MRKWLKNSLIGAERAQMTLLSTLISITKIETVSKKTPQKIKKDLIIKRWLLDKYFINVGLKKTKNRRKAEFCTVKSIGNNTTKLDNLISVSELSYILTGRT